MPSFAEWNISMKRIFPLLIIRLLLRFRSYRKGVLNAWCGFSSWLTVFKNNEVVPGILQTSSVHVVFSYMVNLRIWTCLILSFVILIDTQLVLSPTTGAYVGWFLSHFEIIPVVFIILFVFWYDKIFQDYLFHVLPQTLSP